MTTTTRTKPSQRMSREYQLMEPNRRLEDLTSVGPSTIADLKLLGVRTVESLAKQDPRELFRRLCELSGQKHDPCCEDVFSAAVAQAKDRSLPREMRNWWYWSQMRIRRAAGA